MLWHSYFRSFIKSINLDRCGNFIKKFDFVSTPSKIIIPIAHHPPYHQLNTPSPMVPPTLHPPPTTSLTSTRRTPPPTHSTITADFVYLLILLVMLRNKLNCKSGILLRREACDMENSKLSFYEVKSEQIWKDIKPVICSRNVIHIVSQMNRNEITDEISRLKLHLLKYEHLLKFGLI